MKFIKICKHYKTLSTVHCILNKVNDSDFSDLRKNFKVRTNFKNLIDKKLKCFKKTENFK